MSVNTSFLSLPTYCRKEPTGRFFCSIYKLDEKDFLGMLMATDGLDIIGNVSIKNKLK